MCVEAALEREASAALRTVEGFLCVGPVDGLVSFELQQLGEGFPAVSAAQRLLVRTLFICSTSLELGLEDTFRSRGESWVSFIRIFWVQLTKEKGKLFICFLVFALLMGRYQTNSGGSIPA